MVNNVLLLVQRWSSIVCRSDLLLWIPIVIVPLHSNIAPVTSADDDAVAARVAVPSVVAATAIVPMRTSFHRRPSAAAAST